MPSFWPLIAFAALVGMSVGSFLNVVIFRLPMRESIIRPPSRCLSCGTRLTLPDLVPVFSYLLLRGRCRHCSRRFSPRYMLVELVTGLLAVTCLIVIGPTVYAISVFLMICILIVVFLVDLDWMIIPDETVLLLAGFGVVLNMIGLARGQVGELASFTEHVAGQIWTIQLPSSMVGICVGAGLFLAVGWLAERVFRRPALGFGDVKLAAAVGAILGPGYQFLAFFLYSVFIGAVVGLLLLALRRHRGGAEMPFGPMLALSAAAMLLFPQHLTGLMMRLYG